MLLVCPKCTAKYAVNDNALPPEGRQVRCAKCKHVWFETPKIPDIPPEPSQAAEVEIAGATPEPQAESFAEPAPEISSQPQEEQEAQSFEEHIDSAADEESAGGDAVPVPESEPEGKSRERANYAKKLPAVVANDNPKTPLWLKVSFPVVLLVAVLASMIFYAPQVIAHLPQAQPLYDAAGLSRTDGLVISNARITRIESAGGNAFVIEGNIVNQSAEDRRVPILRISIADRDNKLIRAWDFTRRGSAIKSGEFTPFEAKINFYAQNAKFINLDIGNSFEVGIRD